MKKGEKTMKKLISLLLVLAMAVGLCACGGAPASAPTASAKPEATEAAPAETAAAEPAETNTKVLKMGHVYADTYAMHIAMKAMSDEVYEKTEGRYRIDIAPNSTLGGESDLNEGVHIGTLDMSFTATTPLANIVPKVAFLDMPFLVKDYAHADAVFFDENSPVRQYIMDSIDEAGFKCLTLTENGFRQLYTNKPVTSVAELKGLKVRTMENALHLELWKTLGASPTPMSAGEAMTGLQQGTIDGVEMFHSAFVTNFAGLANYYVGTNHIYTVGTLLLSQRIWNEMSAEDQAVFMEAAQNMSKATIEQLRAEDQGYYEQIINELVEGYTILDQAELEAMVQPMYEKHSEYKDILEQIASIG